MATQGISTARQVSPRIAVLKREYDEARPARVALEMAPPTGADEEFKDAFNRESELAWAIMAEQPAGLPDWAIKLSVYDATVGDAKDTDDDISGFRGSGDRAVSRLLNDARALLASAAVVP